MRKTMSAETRAKLSATMKKRWRMKRRGQAVQGVRRPKQIDVGIARAILRHQRILRELRRAKTLLKRYS